MPTPPKPSILKLFEVIADYQRKIANADYSARPLEKDYQIASELKQIAKGQLMNDLLQLGIDITLFSWNWEQQ